MKHRKNILFLLIIIGMLFLINTSIAYEVNSENSYEGSINNMSTFAENAKINQGHVSLEEKIIGYINILLSFLGIIFLILIIIAGVQWMTSGGNENTIDKAKAHLKSSIIGLLIILGSWVIANGIMQIIVKGKGANLQQDQGIYDASF